MEKKVIELEIIDEIEESGTQKISLVDAPAIEKDWMYFKRVEQFVKPEAGESQSDYMGRCVPAMLDEGKPQDQAVAICISTYENFEVDTSGLAPYTQQTPKEKKDLVEESVNFSAILEKAKTLGFSAEDFSSNGLETVDEDQYINLKLAKGYTVYKYSGSVTDDTRDFCREMVNMDRYYTFDEINALSATDPNPGFGLGGSDNYSIWKYKGGPNCKHRWQKFYVTEKGTIQNKGAAPGTAGEKPIDMPNNGYAFALVEDLKVGDAVSWRTADQNPRGRIKEITYRSKIVPGTEFRIEGTQDDPGYIIEIYERVDGKWSPTGKFVGRKADSILKNVELWRQTFAQVEDKRELVGAVAIPDMEIYRRDKDGNPYYVTFSKDVIRRMAEKFMREKKLAETNIGHEEIEAETYIFESWIVEHPEDKANKVYGLDVPLGSWVIKARVTNDNVWEAVKAGKLKGFSLEGDFVSKEEYEEYMRDKKMYENLISLVSGL